MVLRKINADLHNHLATGNDIDSLDFNKVIDTARKNLGAGGILGICNFDDKRYEQFIKKEGYKRQNLGNAIYVPEKDILVIKGQEIHALECSVLVLGLPEGKNLEGGRLVEDVLKEAKTYEACTGIVHPWHIGGIKEYLWKLIEKISIKEFEKLVDWYEVHSATASLCVPGVTPKNANGKARKTYDFMINDLKIDIGSEISTDGHSVWEIGNSYTTLTMPDYNEMDSKALNKELIHALREHKDYSGKEKTNYIGALLYGLAAFIYLPLCRKLKGEQKTGH
jgi:hypothetical protein